MYFLYCILSLLLCTFLFLCMMLIFLPNVHGSLHLDGYVKRTRHILWSSIWSKAVSHAWCTHPRCHVGSHPCYHTPLHYLGILRAYSSCSPSRQRNCCTCSTICQILDPKPFGQWSSSVHY